MSVLWLALSVGIVWPQGPPQPDRPPRDELFRMVDAYIISNLQEQLDLSDEQFVKLLPLVKRLQSDRRGFAERRQGVLLELRASLRSGTATERRLSGLLDELKEVERREPAAIARDREAIDAVLATAQQAKYRILEVEVERRLRELVERVRGERGPDDGPGRRLPPPQ